MFQDHVTQNLQDYKFLCAKSELFWSGHRGDELTPFLITKEATRLLICIFQYTRADSIQIPAHERVMKINLFRDKKDAIKI
jgi:hypothetical protein